MPIVPTFSIERRDIAALINDGRCRGIFVPGMKRIHAMPQIQPVAVLHFLQFSHSGGVQEHNNAVNLRAATRSNWLQPRGHPKVPAAIHRGASGEVDPQRFWTITVGGSLFLRKTYRWRVPFRFAHKIRENRFITTRTNSGNNPNRTSAIRILAIWPGVKTAFIPFSANV